MTRLHPLKVFNHAETETLADLASRSLFVSHFYRFCHRPPDMEAACPEQLHLLLPTSPCWKHTNLNLVGVEFGRHVAAVEVDLSSVGEGVG